MENPERLGGFKILKGVMMMSSSPSRIDSPLPGQLFRTLAEKAINLPFITCMRHKQGDWTVHLAVEEKDAASADAVMDQTLKNNYAKESQAAILSIFPHRKKPAITGGFFKALGHDHICPNAMAHSPSAISAVLDEALLTRASNALFGPFAFGPYRTPEDWKLAQKGKEKLYKEVVASYQEKRPKVYGLEYQEHQELWSITFNPSQLAVLGALFESFSFEGLDLTFLTAGPTPQSQHVVHFCLPMTAKGTSKDIVLRHIPGGRIETLSPVGTFSMNGPHFGDRYGIVSDLMEALKASEVTLMGLSCTIASITGVVLSSHLENAVSAIQNCFDVPTTIKTDRKYS